jgi:HAD superfamily hydrolase (TIGR01484 family)
MTQTHTRAIIFNLDGTALKIEPKATPSTRVVESLKKAYAKAHAIMSTNRNWSHVKPLVKSLHITSPVLTLGGAQVVDATNGKVLWEQDLDPGIAERILEIAKTYPGVKAIDQATDKPTSLKTFKVKPVMSHISVLIDETLLQDFVKQVKKIPLLLVETSPGAENGMMEVTVKHIHATKFMALQTVAKTLGLNPKECVGVGNSSHDIALLNFCGTKVAMGNATERLKELAHHVAPSVDEDGLAWVIDQFILNENSPKPPVKK